MDKFFISKNYAACTERQNTTKHVYGPTFISKNYIAERAIYTRDDQNKRGSSQINKTRYEF